MANTTRQDNEILPENFFIAEKYKIIIMTDNAIPPRENLNCNFLSLNKKMEKRESAADKPVNISRRKVLPPFRKAVPLAPTLVPE